MAPNSCLSKENGLGANTTLPHSVESFDKVHPVDLREKTIVTPVTYDVFILFSVFSNPVRLNRLLNEPAHVALLVVASCFYGIRARLRSLDLFGATGPLLSQVMVLTQEYGQAYYHFVVDNLSRITVLLDVLLENPDIKVQSGPGCHYYYLGRPVTMFSVFFMPTIPVTTPKNRFRRAI